MKHIFHLLILALMTTQAAAQELKPVAYADGDQKLNGLITSNTDAERPGVLLLPAWMGIDDEARTAAIELAKQGYIVLIADIYGEGHVPTNATEARTIATHYKTDFAAYQHRITLALEQLKLAGADPEKLAVIGYCFGGSGALEAARVQLPVKGVVSIHGGLGKGDRPNGPLSTSILIQHPEADASVSKEDMASVVSEMNAANADWQMVTYAHCAHTFTNPASKDYNKQMADRAWQHLLVFLKEVLD
ncbi:MAG TPA: dienelactone hydrolase family protein [Flavobacteriales bacterium]|nr:dienelactone hydrolase family protein [Flavobacteriales bacterium]